MITHGDVLDVLQGTPDEVYHSCFCDPPYGLGETPDMAEVLTHWLAGDDYKARGGGFMGKGWDSFVPGPAIWKEVYRVLRPGAILMAFGGTRTADLLSIAIRLAGFERFDEISYHGTTIPGSLDWVYGSGFPKGCDISKQIDKEAGQVREVVGYKPSHRPNRVGGNSGSLSAPYTDALETAPATDAARTWAGYNVALKPAHEPVLLFRKPRRATYAQTALQHGTGCLNIDGCRIETNGDSLARNNRPGDNGWKNSSGGPNGAALREAAGLPPQGRWPANVVLDDEAGRLLDAQSGERPTGIGYKNASGTNTVYGRYAQRGNNEMAANGGDTGGASRFFYCVKASRAEREAGLEGLPLREVAAMQGNLVDGQRLSGKGEPIKTPIGRNNHPCCKPLKLTEYLARLIVPPVEYRDDARLLVCFCGSGSEMIGAYRAGWLHVDGIDNEASYIEIAERRIAHELSKGKQLELICQQT